MAGKYDLITTLTLNAQGFEGGINKAKQATKELSDNIKGSTDVLGSLGGAMGGITGDMTNAISSLAGAATGIGLVVAAVGLLASAFKTAQENVDLYLASVDKSKQGEGIFTKQAGEIVGKNISRESGGVMAERMVELKTGAEVAALDAKRLVNFLTGNKAKNESIKLTQDELRAQNEQAHVLEKIQQEVLDGDRNLGNRIPKELEVKKVLLEQFDLQKEAVQEAVKNAEIEKQLKKDRAIITDNSGQYTPAQKKAALVDFEETAKAYALKRESLINREITNTQALGKLSGDEMGTIKAVAVLETERANAGTAYYAEEIAQNRLLSRVKKDALAEQIAAEKAFHKLKEDNMTSEAGFKLGTKDVNVGTAKNPYVEERAGYANTQQLIKPSANAVGAVATDANKVTVADKALKAYNGTLKTTIDLNNKYAQTQENINTALADFASSVQGGADSFKEFGKTVANSIRQVISALLSKTIAEAIAKAMDTAKNPFIGLALGALAGGLAATLFNSLVPKFSEGGVVGGTSYSGDNVPAMLNSGERVLTVNQQANMMGGGTVLFKFQNGALQGQLEHDSRQRNSH